MSSSFAQKAMVVPGRYESPKAKAGLVFRYTPAQEHQNNQKSLKHFTVPTEFRILGCYWGNPGIHSQRYYGTDFLAVRDWAESRTKCRVFPKPAASFCLPKESRIKSEISIDAGGL
jgi:hypothetical protein